MQLFANNANSKLVAGISATALSLQVTAGDGAKFPSPTGGDYFLITLSKVTSGIESAVEIVKCTGRSTDVLTILRAQEGTTARVYATDDFVQLRVTAGVMGTHESHVTNVSNPHATTKAQVGLGSVDNTADTAKPVSTAQQTALDLKQSLSFKDATGGYAGLTGFNINFKNAANTFTSQLANVNTAARTYTFPDRSGTIADNTDLALKAPLASPTFTGTVAGITATMVGLGNVTNTSDASKPVSTAQQTALDLKANLASPTFTGVPAVPTATAGTNTTQAASTAFVVAAITGLIAAAPGALDTLDELAAALGDDANFAATITTALALKAPLASPTFTGTVAGITKAMVGLGSVDNTADASKPVSTAQQTALNLKLNLAGGTMSGAIAMGNSKITGLATPTSTADAATKAYADGLISDSSTGTATTWSSTKLTNSLKNGVQVTDFGAVGNGTTNDTVSIQAAINSGAKLIVFPAGFTFLTDEVSSYGTDTTFYAVGSIIKLKASSTAYRTLTVNHARCTIIGGTWDGNKTNQTAGDAFSSWAIGIHADDGAVYEATIKNFRGCGVKVVGGNRCTVERCNITDIGYSTSLTCFGIYMETAAGNPLYGNRARDNYIKLNNNGLADQGILFTSNSTTGGEAQWDWEISGNTVYGSTNASVGDLAINLAVRGHRGKVFGNTTVAGAMGWSEGGDKTIIEDNTFLDTVGSVRWGIEPSGEQMVIANNVLTGHLRGICFSFDNNDDILISGNTIETDGTANLCIAAEISATGTGKNVTIIGNVLKGRRGIVATRQTQGINIVGNTFVGPGSATSGSRFVFFDTPTSTTMFANIKGNKISACERAVSVYSASATTYTDVAFNDNNCRDDVAGGVFAHVIAEGSAVLGSRIKNFNNEQNSTTDNFAMLFDNTNKRGIEYSNSYTTPEGNVTAGVGSLYVNLGGTGPVLWTKNSGTGNTGWDQAVNLTATQTLSNKTFSGRVTLTNSSNGAVTALTDGATITPDFNTANNFSVTLGGNRTLANPTNLTAGQSGVITVTQDATGSRTLAFGSQWKFPGGTAPTLTTTAAAVDVIAYYAESSTRITARVIGDVK